MTYYEAQVSAVLNRIEGAKSDLISQKTRVSAPVLETYLYGATYLMGLGTAGDNIVNCRIFKHGSTTAFATGTMTGEVLKIYLTANPNIIPGELYDVCVLDGRSGTTIIEGMRTTFKVEVPTISLNPVSPTQKIVSGVTAKNIQVRISQNATAKTIIWSDAGTGAYSWLSATAVAGDTFKVETKVGNEYSSSAEYTIPVQAGAPSTPTNLAVSAITQTTTTLSWTASPTATSYKIYQNGYTTTVWKTTTNTNFPLTGTAGSTWRYQVSAVNEHGDSLRSEEVSVTYPN